MRKICFLLSLIALFAIMVGSCSTSESSGENSALEATDSLLGDWEYIVYIGDLEYTSKLTIAEIDATTDLSIKVTVTRTRNGVTDNVISNIPSSVPLPIPLDQAFKRSQGSTTNFELEINGLIYKQISIYITRTGTVGSYRYRIQTDTTTDCESIIKKPTRYSEKYASELTVITTTKLITTTISDTQNGGYVDEKTTPYLPKPVTITIPEDPKKPTDEEIEDSIEEKKIPYYFVSDQELMFNGIIYTKK